MTIKDLKKNTDLKKYNTLKVSAIAQYFYEATSRQNIIDLYKLAKKENLKIIMVGGGSNIAIVSKQIKGIVVRNLYIEKKLIKQDNNNFLYLVSSGYPTPKLVFEITNMGLKGMEYFRGIPGTIGGALYMNSKWTNPLSSIGDNVESVFLLDKNCNVKKVNKDYFKFAYDYSILQKTKEIILEAIFKFDKGIKKNLEMKSENCFKYRKESQPYGVATSGCFFRNISEAERQFLGFPTTSSGYLIDKAGLKGYKVGDFIISKDHANFIINTNNGKPENLKELLNIIKKTIKSKYNIELKEEVVILD